jgi:hypothetical protein
MPIAGRGLSASTPATFIRSGERRHDAGLTASRRLASLRAKPYENDQETEWNDATS